MSDKEDILNLGENPEDILKEMPEAVMYGSPEMDFCEHPQSQGLMYGPPERDFREIKDFHPFFEKDDNKKKQ